ncbi:MAG: SIMPL domain-containing protein, partial [Acetobacteraceae bacterium]
MSIRAGLAALSVLAVLAAAPGARADTILDLSETGHVSAQPDEIAASLRAEATAPAPDAAQAAVNQAMKRALDAARATQGVTVNTGQYSVWLAEPPPPPHPGAARAGSPTWHASQTLDLTGHDGHSMLALVGALQGQGMAVQALAWQLSPDATRTALEAALRQAVSG